MERRAIILLGPPGSGKGTQSEKIMADFEVYYISTGEVLRDWAKKDTPLGKEVAKIMNQGKLVSDHHVTEIIEAFFEDRGYDKDYLLDGFPRTEVQAIWFKSFLAQKNMQSVVLYIHVEDDEIVKRILERSRDEDDNEETVRSRISTFHETRDTLVGVFGDQVIPINGQQSVDDVYKDIKKTLER